MNVVKSKNFVKEKEEYSKKVLKEKLKEKLKAKEAMSLHVHLVGDTKDKRFVRLDDERRIEMRK